MRLLLDNCISRRVADALREEGHDVSAVAEWEIDPGDDALMARAFRERRVLVTLDTDFGELAIVRKLPHAGILRIDEQDYAFFLGILKTALARSGRELEAGAIAVATRDQIRVHVTEN